jgi:2-oxoglutarate ferredoxin oxidoreductase subunit gamma
MKTSDLLVAEINATSIAEELGNVRSSNMVALGAYVAARPVVKQASLISSLKKVLKRQELISMNEKAIKLGAQSVHIKR